MVLGGITKERETPTELLQVRQPFVHTPPQFRPLGELVLCTRLQELLLVEQNLRLELALSYHCRIIKYA